MYAPAHLFQWMLLLVMLSACMNPGERTDRQASPTVFSTTRARFSCPVSPSQSSLRPDMAALAGEFPVWLTVGTGRVAWTKLPVSLPPYSGRMDKVIWTVDTRVKGDLRITGKQLDGDGILLFAHTAKQQIDDKGQDLGGVFDGQPSDVWVIHTAEKGAQNSPPGFQDHGSLVYYPHPGCYQYEATIAGHTIHVVTEVLDQ